MSKNKAKEIVEEIGENLAAGLEEYANLVKQLAENLTEEDLENTDSIKHSLRDQLPNFDCEDWYDLLIEVRCKKHQTEHEEQTAKKILHEMQFPIRAASNEAVNQLLESAIKRRLYGFDNGTRNTVKIIWKIFYCSILDIKNSIKKVSLIVKPLTENDELEHKRLLLFTEALREKLWERGEVLKLREIE